MTGTVQMGKFIKKADIILIVILAALGVILAAASFSGSSGKRAVVRVNGEIYGVYDLAEDREVEIHADGHFNKFIIRGGQAQMTEADCMNHDCIKTGPAGMTNQSIVCLPNRVSITIEGEEGENDVDIIAG